MQKTVSEVFGLGIPKPFKSKQNPDKTSNDDLMVGIELEIENLTRGYDHYLQQGHPFWSVVEDGSLRPRGQSWEFVSVPANLGTALAELRVLLEKLRVDDRNYTDRCSVHVHTNVLNFNQQQVASLALVYPVFEMVLFQYVNHFKAPDEQGYCRDTNLYCIPWSDCRMNRNFVEKFFRYPEEFTQRRGVHNWQKYTALNFLPISQHGTVEWRHMHGTADMEKLTTWLNVIGAIMKFCHDSPFDDIVKTIKVLNDVSTYQQFFTAVLGGTLPYHEQYRRSMAEGVINAKYSLVNWEANKGKENSSVKKSQPLYGGEAEQDEGDIEAINRANGVDPLAARADRILGGINRGWVGGDWGDARGTFAPAPDDLLGVQQQAQEAMRTQWVTEQIAQAQQREFANILRPRVNPMPANPRPDLPRHDPRARFVRPR